MVLMLIVGPLQGGVVDYGLGGERASGGVEIVVTIVISRIWVSGKEMDSWSRSAVPWSRRTVAWKSGAELHLIHKATGDLEFNVTLIVSTVQSEDMVLLVAASFSN